MRKRPQDKIPWWIFLEERYTIFFAMKRILACFFLTSSMLLAVVAGQTFSSSLLRPGIALNINADQDVTITSATTTTGTIRHGGVLNGTTADVFTSIPVAVGGGSTLALTDTLTITAEHGTLNCSDVTLFNPTQRVFTTICTISSGTGIFKGANGTLFISGTSTDGIHYEDKVTGQITIFPSPRS
jgi:hypothetical protein